MIQEEDLKKSLERKVKDLKEEYKSLYLRRRIPDNITVNNFEEYCNYIMSERDKEKNLTYLESLIVNNYSDEFIIQCANYVNPRDENAVGDAYCIAFKYEKFDLIQKLKDAKIKQVYINTSKKVFSRAIKNDNVKVFKIFEEELNNYDIIRIIKENKTNIFQYIVKNHEDKLKAVINNNAVISYLEKECHKDNIVSSYMIKHIEINKNIKIANNFIIKKINKLDLTKKENVEIFLNEFNLNDLLTKTLVFNNLIELISKEKYNKYKFLYSKILKENQLILNLKKTNDIPSNLDYTCVFYKMINENTLKSYDLFFTKNVKKDFESEEVKELQIQKNKGVINKFTFNNQKTFKVSGLVNYKNLFKEKICVEVEKHLLMEKVATKLTIKNNVNKL